jgi:uncharacterized protein YutE (UPF0331/DUF86 family)
MDRERVLAKVDEIRKYIDEIRKVAPSSFDEYEYSIEKKRACERLLQISIEAVLDICNIILSSLKIGLPSDEEDAIKKLTKKDILTKETGEIVQKMKGFRNILVHKYGVVEDEIVYSMLSKIDDFDVFTGEVLDFISEM